MTTWLSSAIVFAEGLQQIVAQTHIECHRDIEFKSFDNIQRFYFGDEYLIDKETLHQTLVYVECGIMGFSVCGLTVCWKWGKQVQTTGFRLAVVG